MTDFDTANHWMIDRGDGTPSVNLVVLSFVNPLKLLNQTNDSHQLAANWFSSPRLRQRHGAQQAAQCLGGGIQLAAAHQRLSAHHASRATAGSCKDDR
jgi:hypothetical protein